MVALQGNINFWMAVTRFTTMSSRNNGTKIKTTRSYITLSEDVFAGVTQVQRTDAHSPMSALYACSDLT